jgi:hypothetical protein
VLQTCAGGLVFKRFDRRASYLVAGAAETTPKLAQALVAKIPIVTMAWVNALASRSTPTAPFPDINDYMPTPVLDSM